MTTVDAIQPTVSAAPGCPSHHEAKSRARTNHAAVSWATAMRPSPRSTGRVDGTAGTAVAGAERVSTAEGSVREASRTREEAGEGTSRMRGDMGAREAIGTG